MTKTTKTTDRTPIIAMISVAIIILAAAVGGFLILNSLPPWLTTGSSTIVILLVAGLVSVTLLLYLGTMILRTAGLSTKKEALGMPEGSIRALIAMSLILMFAIIGVTVLYTGMGGDAIQSNGITAAELERLENVQIIAISVVDPAASPGAERFNVTARPELSQAGHDFGLQLLTTVSTLVVAVAGFYFGSRAVSQGAKTASQAAANQAAAATANAAGAGDSKAATGSETKDDAGGESEEESEDETGGESEQQTEDETGDDTGGDSEAETEDDTGGESEEESGGESEEETEDDTGETEDDAPRTGSKKPKT